jgi:hypothetical protein
VEEIKQLVDVVQNSLLANLTGKTHSLTDAVTGFHDGRDEVKTRLRKRVLLVFTLLASSSTKIFFFFRHVSSCISLMSSFGYDSCYNYSPIG